MRPALATVLAALEMLTAYDLDLFGPNPSDKAAKNRAVCFLLRVCLELEHAAA